MNNCCFIIQIGSFRLCLSQDFEIHSVSEYVASCLDWSRRSQRWPPSPDEGVQKPPRCFRGHGLRACRQEAFPAAGHAEHWPNRREPGDHNNLDLIPPYLSFSSCLNNYSNWYWEITRCALCVAQVPRCALRIVQWSVVFGDVACSTLVSC